MSNVLGKKIFRKYNSSSPKNRIQPLLGSLLILAADLLIVLAFLFTYRQLNSSSWAIFRSTSVRIVLFLGFICSFFLVLLILCIFSSNRDPVYTLILDAYTLHYEDDGGSYDLKLPCSCKKTANTIFLSDGSIKLALHYDEEKDTDLLEFLKNVIN